MYYCKVFERYLRSSAPRPRRARTSMYDRKVFERYLRPDEERQLFATVAQYADVLAQRDLAWMRLLRQTGIRVGSLAGLTVDDARQALREKRLQVRGEHSKGGRGYSVLLNKKALTALRDLLRIRREIGRPDFGEAPLVVSRKNTGKGMSVRSFQDRMQHWRTAAGLSVEASPHWFRHTLAKRIVERSTAKDPRAIVQHALGHANIISGAVYTFPDREDLEQSMEEAS